ncbi:hypothetical protein JNUCC1_02282 [Lentibacillus sp. JNUCC-1]|uniref:YtzI protein n=1 Tax=Lentibacillus sp. JNUCC-1 TaxID=2654513 RepID=UPI0012E904EE|nr:YtzI protein [Lentibacillus sp. JNUCC-1]MUV38444.1 hypothetical protein [Lentibacillus sp. JNUCC-1]
MGFYTMVVMIAVITIFVLGLSLLTISKGYAHKHTIDPLPDDSPSNKKDNEGL